jgi:hypothetical protein
MGYEALRLLALGFVPDHVELILHHNRFVELLSLQDFDQFFVHRFRKFKRLVVDAEDSP